MASINIPPVPSKLQLLINDSLVPDIRKPQSIEVKEVPLGTASW